MRNAAIALSFLLMSATVNAQTALDPRAEEVIAKTRTTTADYSLFLWTQAKLPGQAPISEWTAEFHSGHLHRLETPRVRIIADCEARSGTYFDVLSGKTQSGPAVAGVACGVSSNAPILTARYDGSQSTAFGVADLITLHDNENVRTCQVAQNGALIAATIEDDDGMVLVKNWATALLDTTPSDIFSRESLERSAVPDRYRTLPQN